MNFNDIQQVARTLYYPAFVLENIFSHELRKKIRLIFTLLTVILGFVSAFFYFSQFLPFFTSLLSFTLASKLYGLFSIFLSISLFLFMLEAFYYSYCHEEGQSGIAYIDFDFAYAIYKTDPHSIAYTFFQNNLGELVLMRAGVSVSDYTQFLTRLSNGSSAPEVPFQCEIENNTITLSSFLVALYAYDKMFAEFIFTYGVQKKELVGIAEWITESAASIKAREYWWSKENLSRLPGIGRDWSYGRAYTLEKYRRSLPSISSAYTVHSSYGVEELKQLESVLSRKRGGNALIVGNDIGGTVQIIGRLNSLIAQDNVLAELKSKNLVLLDNDALVSSHGSKAEFEQEFMLMMNEAVRAGNIILVIENLPSFISSTAGISSELPSLLEPYLSSGSLNIIALSDTERFHTVIEKNATFMQNFETILVKEVDESNTIRVLENELIRYEYQGFFFTYPALVAIADSAERYFPDGIMPDKAIDLLVEIIPKLQLQGKYKVEKADVISLVESKTGIPLGTVKAEEKDKLLHLEDILHKRIVGQEEAVKAISSSVRRARSGINNPNRPLGSFLFLGPTGVGKTETTKALGEVFFGAEAHIMRLDMSEYSGADAPSKLIGSFAGKQEGVLSSMIREHQYGVLLLDEFEKTTPEVMNLFLQILDEGFFSDESGKKVLARNLIIIATSNAGSDLIWEAVKRGDNLATEKDVIIDAIIKQGTFKPELLNRFDGVIVFHPLTDENLRVIASLMLQKLHERLAERGMNLVINDALINYVVGYGTDPKFGARPMNRAIQEKVEQIVAEKIIRGDVSPGQSIVLGETDFASV